MKKIYWGIWLLLTISLAGYFGFGMLASQDKTDFLIGDASHGHFQIEMACETCHTDAFGGQEMLQQACLSCHAEELEEAHDSHPKKKFTDPREAHRIKILDARYCVSCHTEHQEEQTRTMGVTLPDDYCFHCHKDIGEERESHKDLPFDSCASSGCHNYHDNRALYESFLVKNADQPWLSEIAKITNKPIKQRDLTPLTRATSQFKQYAEAHPNIAEHWEATAHAAAGIDCGGCHTTKDEPDLWIEKPGLTQCATCHKNEVLTFTQGKHGMRLAKQVSSDLNAITPGESKLDFHHTQMSTEHGCNSCHSAHSFNTQTAAAESCLTCHADEHSLAFSNSPHGKLWEKEITGEAEANTGVSCATCHMPRIEKSSDEIFVQHNQNWNLRPNEKMIRSVCLSCHSLEFSIDALADPNLIKNNFNGKPGIHIESIDWAKERVEQK